MRANSIVWLLPVLALLAANSYAGPFNQGSKTLSVVLGSGRAFNDNYTIAGAGFGYYVLDGLELGIEAQSWFGGQPSITKVSPQIQYVHATNQELKPYIGAFFRRTYIDGFDDLDSAGARGGLFFSSRSASYLSIGFVYETYLDCNSSIYASCSDTYPELNIVFAL